WRGRAALSPFQFYARLLSGDGGRRAMEARLGAEACDALDEFLQLALHAERDGIFSLARFLADLDGAHLEIKRDMEAAGDCVRVMTVHAAKGLEAKIVFLPDTCGVPSAQHDPKIYRLQDPVTGEALPVWAVQKDQDPDVVAKAREDARAEAGNEHRRLLYVALTRAEERLYIAGFYNKREPGEVAWAKMVSKSANGFEEIPAFWDNADKILRRETPGTRIPDSSPPVEALSPQAIIVPDFLLRPAPAETSPMPPLKPATALAAADALPIDETGRLRREALERGRLTHVLLQYLPQVSPEGRRAAAKAFLAARAPRLAPWHEELITQALNVLGNKGLAALFGPRSRAEVAVAGRITAANGKLREVSGQVDRIVETEDEVLVADFKTGMVHDAASAPAAFLTQMALYRAALAPLWPEKRLRMLLIFTAGPQVVELEPQAMDKALAALSL
ncbi:MAG: double-strand break repair helicase AddA, partial [Beijerinckiaceae bacterium]